MIANATKEEESKDLAATKALALPRGLGALTLGPPSEGAGARIEEVPGSEGKESEEPSSRA